METNSYKNLYLDIYSNIIGDITSVKKLNKLNVEYPYNGL